MISLLWFGHLVDNEMAWNAGLFYFWVMAFFGLVVAFFVEEEHWKDEKPPTKVGGAISVFDVLSLAAMGQFILACMYGFAVLSVFAQLKAAHSGNG